jgi:hypothetical protein
MFKIDYKLFDNAISCELRETLFQVVVIPSKGLEQKTLFHETSMGE